MQQTQQPFNSNQLAVQTLFPVLSIAFERLCYYGIRSFIFIYASEVFGYKQSMISILYGIMLYIPLGLRPIGGLLADRILGYRKSMAIGNLLMILACISLLIPNEIGLFIGLTLILLSNSIYAPATYTQLLKVYNGHDKQRDGAMTLLYLAINIGAFFGPVLIALTGADFNYTLGFILAGVASVIALVFSLFCTEKLPIPQPSELSALKSSKKTGVLIGIVLSSAMFWIVYEYQGFQLEMNLYFTKFKGYPSTLIGTLSCIGFAAILGLTWYFASISSKLKWIIGFGIALCGICLVWLAQNVTENIPWIVAGTLLFSLAEIFSFAIQSKLIQRYASQKYLATTIALTLSAASAIATLSTSYISDLFVTHWIHIVFILVALVVAILFVKFVKDPSQKDDPEADTEIQENELLDQ